MECEWCLNRRLACDCYRISDGAVFRELSNALLSPIGDPFPLRLKAPHPWHVDNRCQSFLGMGLTLEDVEAVLFPRVAVVFRTVGRTGIIATSGQDTPSREQTIPKQVVGNN